ncbi:non-canonical purine NTP pyrophosphatase [Candidatus Peregrinibacteria bacterium CG22_combo_CG10-13_8_21_14_all_49_11]|nr:MAG: non-canonical purine NTP pyrophosphatase [Candidatus Peregrinibacteria bacterium CG22_combo_CG10-13_8_21_14_all_49_11]
MHLLIGTNNPGKVLEAKDIFEGLPLELLTPEDLGIQKKPEETGETYRENALMKARFFQKAVNGHAVVADDSGIIVDALKNELGVQTRRWGLGDSVSDREYIEHFIKRMKREDVRTASFISSVVFIDQDGNEHCFEGRVTGTITDALECDLTPGLPFDACFRPDGYDCVFGQLSLEVKNTISHRAIAFRKVREFLLS